MERVSCGQAGSGPDDCAGSVNFRHTERQGVVDDRIENVEGGVDGIGSVDGGITIGLKSVRKTGLYGGAALPPGTLECWNLQRSSEALSRGNVVQHFADVAGGEFML
jgi:hypothetical protein